MKVVIDYASEHQLQQMYQRFYPEQHIEKSLQFARKALSYEKKNVSMAQIQGYFMLHKSEPNSALENIDKLWTL